jgi:L-seryl-tRNA(Ser) seleniumtransferase
MLRIPAATLESTARALATALAHRIAGLEARVVKGFGEVGGGSLPRERLRGFVVELRHAGRSAQELERLARAAAPPVIGTVRAGAYRLDPRTLLEGEADEVVESLARAWT